MQVYTSLLILKKLCDTRKGYKDMTIEEKAKRIESYCESMIGCGECKLKNESTTTCYDASFTEEIESNYRTVFGDDEEKEIQNNVNHPAHYQGKNECIDVMVAMFGKEAVKHFCMCNAYKYRFRAYKKNGAEDIKKAEWYESKLIELRGEENGR